MIAFTPTTMSYRIVSAYQVEQGAQFQVVQDWQVKQGQQVGRISRPYPSRPGRLRLRNGNALLRCTENIKPKLYYASSSEIYYQKWTFYKFIVFIKHSGSE